MIEFFTDPVLAAPTIGSMIMCAVAGFVGTFSLLKHESLIGETLSHASYPGVILALIVAKLLLAPSDDTLFFLVPLFGAALSCIWGMRWASYLTKHLKVAPDSALSFILASFFGVALLLLTSQQTRFPTLYRELQGYLFGQAALQTSANVWTFVALAFVVVVLVRLFYRPIKCAIFDPEFAEVIGINQKMVSRVLLGITVLAVIVGIRLLGVVLMSAMLIFPAVTARFWTNRLAPLLGLAAIFGLIAGFLGVYISHQTSMISHDDGRYFSFPTGPMIVVVAAALFLFSALFSLKRGVLVCAFRRVAFQRLCKEENLLKALWKHCSEAKMPKFSKSEIASSMQLGPLSTTWLFANLCRRGWIKKISSDVYELTSLGMLWGRKIVRLHRLWEVYLVEYCGVGKDRVHVSAEEMEHIITPEMEKELEVILHNPHVDPHHQPIPPSEEELLRL